MPNIRRPLVPACMDPLPLAQVFWNPESGSINTTGNRGCVAARHSLRRVLWSQVVAGQKLIVVRALGPQFGCLIVFRILSLLLSVRVLETE